MVDACRRGSYDHKAGRRIDQCPVYDRIHPHDQDVCVRDKAKKCLAGFGLAPHHITQRLKHGKRPGGIVFKIGVEDFHIVSPTAPTMRAARRRPDMPSTKPHCSRTIRALPSRSNPGSRKYCSTSMTSSCSLFATRTPLLCRIGWIWSKPYSTMPS